MQVATGADRVAGFADRADPLPLQDPLAAAQRRGPWQVGVEVAAPLPLTVKRQVVAVEDRVVAAARDRPFVTATSSVPQAAVMSKPSCTRPPLRGTPKSPTAPRTPCGPFTGKRCP